MPRPTSAWETTEALGCQREGHACEPTTALVDRVDSQTPIYVNNINDNEPSGDEEGFQDFKFDLPTEPKMRSLFSVIEACVRHKVTSAQLRRVARRSIREELRVVQGMSRELRVLNKPSALCAADMATTINMTYGKEAITDCPLRPDEMRIDHQRMHLNCSSECYFWNLYYVAKNGWRLPNKRYHIKVIKKNHPPFDYFGSCSQASLEKQLDVAGAVEDAPVGEAVHINPMLSVIRNSDMYRASEAGFTIEDEASLLAANKVLNPPIKIRVCLDAGANGLNKAQPDFPFSYASINDAIALMTPGCYMAKLDLSNMYLTLGLAKETRKYFGFINLGVKKRYKRMPFGKKLAPSVLSAFMAEVLAIAASHGITAVINYMDDFFIVGSTYVECLHNLNFMIALLQRYGWSIAEDKTVLPSQAMTFIGVLLDSRSMTLSIEPEKARAVLFKLKAVRAALITGKLSPSMIYSLAGNCMWFSSVITIGKLYTRPLFELLKLMRSSSKVRTSELLSIFDKAFDWWHVTLETWSAGMLLRSNVRVIPSQLIADAIFLQQDAGDEGLGYFSTLVEEGFKRVRWYARLLPNEDETSSTYKELSTIVWAVKSRREWANKLVVAVFDSSAAAFGVNNGSSPSRECMELIEELYLLCDEFNITLVALWTPRRLTLKAPSIYDRGSSLAGWIGILREVDKSAFEKKSIEAYVRTQHRFEQFVSTLDPWAVIWPAAQMFVRIFLVFMFFSNKMSAASLPGYLTHLKSGQLDRQYAWLEGAELRAVNLTLKSLQKMSIRKCIKRKAPMTLAKMRSLEAHLNSKSKKDRQYATLARVCHNALLRSGEGVKIRFRHFTWSPDRTRLRLLVHNSKCNKTGPPEVIDLVDWGSESAVAYLRAYFDEFQLWKADDNSLVFDLFDKAAFVRRVKELVKLARIDGDFAGHSFRSGGASDLYAANVPIEAIMKLGRWQSSAALLYLRCEEVTALKIAHAFRLSSDFGFEFWNTRSDIRGMGEDHRKA